MLFAGSIGDNIAYGLNMHMQHGDLNPELFPHSTTAADTADCDEERKCDHTECGVLEAELTSLSAVDAASDQKALRDANELFYKHVKCAAGCSESERSAVRAAVVRAAKLSAAHEFIIGLPDGYDTEVGSNGASMSGGKIFIFSVAFVVIWCA